VTCSVLDCDKPAERNGLCAGHRKRAQRGSTVAGQLADVNRSPREVLLDACLRYADADDDIEYKRASDTLLKAAESFASRRTRERIRAALEAAAARGVKVGRPLKLTVEAVMRVRATVRTQMEAALRLGVHVETIRRYYKRYPTKG
jgi:hypothetical protein